MDVSRMDRQAVGALGEKIACEYARRVGMRIVARNVAKKTGELDIVARKGDTLHFIEVKTILCYNFPSDGSPRDDYDPSVNLHEAKVRRVARTAEWYVVHSDWEGEWQIDAVLVWLRRTDGRAFVRYLPQIL